MEATQDTAHLVEDESVGAAAEGGELHHQQAGVRTLPDHVGGLEDSIRVRPLAERIDMPKDALPRMCRHILRNHIHAHGGNGVGYLVLNQRVDMIRSCRQENDHTPCLFGVVQHLQPSLL